MDLDINNYNYNELLVLFNLEKDGNIDINKIKTKMKIIKEQLGREYYVFYMKAVKIILVIYDLKKYNIMQKDDIRYYVEKIKKIPAFEMSNVDILVADIIKKYNLINSPNYDMERDVVNRDGQFESPVINRFNTAPNIAEQIETNIVIENNLNSVAPGKLNSIKRLTHFINLNLNSCFRNNYNSTNPCDFKYMIPNEVKNVVSLRLASIEIPNSWYLFSGLKKNNTFTMVVNDNSYEIVIKDGNYDQVTLVNYLNTKYFYLSETKTDLIYIKFSINQYSFKSKFKVVGCPPSPLNMSFFFFENNEQIMNSLGWTIGFRMGKYIDIQCELVSEGLFDAGGDRYIYVAVDDYQYNSNALNMVCFDKGIMEKNIIAKIPMMNGKLSMIMDDNSAPLTKTRRYNGPVNIRNLNIKILDKFGEVIDLNNMDYSLTLEIEVLYEGFNFKHINA